MNLKSLQIKQAFYATTLDIINEVVSYSEDLKYVVDSFIDRIRELNGSKVLIMVQYLYDGDNVSKRILGITPSRYKKNVNKFNGLIGLTYNLSGITVLSAKDNDEASSLLRGLGYDLSIILPLRFGNTKIGTILALGVPSHCLDDILRLQGTLAKTIAIVLRNALLIEEQKENIHKWEKAEAELKRHKETLKETIRDRTVDLINVNQELEQRINEQKETEKALKDSEERYKRLTDNVIDIIFRVTIPKGICEYINPAVNNILGYSQKECYKTPFFIAKVIHPKWKKYLNGQWYNLVNGIVAPFYEYQVISRSGNAKWLYQRSVIIYNKSHKPIAIEGIITDITERKKAEEAVKNLNNNLEKIVTQRTQQLELNYKEREALSYSISHDLRAPLRAIDGFSQAIIEDYGDKFDDTAKNYLKRIRLASQHLGIIMDEQLKLLKILKEDLSKDNVNLSNIANSIIDNLKKDFPDRKVEFIVAKDITVIGAPSLLKVVMENLLGNSWKFTKYKSNAIIEFGVKRGTKENIYFIKDNGIGFDMSFSNKLFKPFQQLHVYNNLEGYGVGLAMVKRIIDRHNGKIWAQSTINKGTTFYFIL